MIVYVCTSNITLFSLLKEVNTRVNTSIIVVCQGIMVVYPIGCMV